MSHVRIKEGKFQVNTAELPTPVRHPSANSSMLWKEKRWAEYDKEIEGYNVTFKLWNADINWVNVRDEDYTAILKAIIHEFGKSSGPLRTIHDWTPDPNEVYEVDREFDMLESLPPIATIRVPSTEEEKTKPKKKLKFSESDFVNHHVIESLKNKEDREVYVSPLQPSPPIRSAEEILKENTNIYGVEPKHLYKYDKQEILKCMELYAEQFKK